jgi:CBS domain-containing protein
VSPSDLINPLLKVGDAMTADPRTCSPASTVVEAVLVMRDADCGVIPVTEAGAPVGVLTDRDIALALPDHETDLARIPVTDLMTKDLVTVGRDDTIASAMEKLGGEGVRRLLVVDSEGRLVGVLSWTDLVPHVSERGLGQVVARLVEHRW